MGSSFPFSLSLLVEHKKFCVNPPQEIVCLMTVERSDFCFCFWLIYDKVWISLFKILLLKSGLLSNIVVFGSTFVKR